MGLEQGSRDGAVRAGDVLDNPDLLLHGIHFGHRVCQFLEVNRDTYELSSFLDERSNTRGGRLVEVDLGQIASLLEKIPQRRHPPGFIAHTSFCCSTLLARSLAFFGRSLVLREPQVLIMLARAFREHPDHFPGPARHACLELVLRLLNKSYAARERVLIKPSNLANRLLEDWLERYPRARGVLVTSSLEDYLVSVLGKTPDTQRKMNWVAATLARDSDYLSRCPELDRPFDDPLEAAAVAWHAQRHQLGALVARHPARVMALDQAMLLARPFETVSRVCRHLEVDAGPDEVRQRIQAPLWTRHAKDPAHPYDPDQRRRDHERTRRRHEHGIHRVMAWLAPYLKRVPDPFDALYEPPHDTNQPPALARAGRNQ